VSDIYFEKALKILNKLEELQVIKANTEQARIDLCINDTTYNLKFAYTGVSFSGKDLEIILDKGIRYLLINRVLKVSKGSNRTANKKYELLKE